jgi:hypothetical protein
MSGDGGMLGRDGVSRIVNGSVSGDVETLTRARCAWAGVRSLFVTWRRYRLRASKVNLLGNIYVAVLRLLKMSIPKFAIKDTTQRLICLPRDARHWKLWLEYEFPDQ